VCPPTETIQYIAYVEKESTLPISVDLVINGNSYKIIYFLSYIYVKRFLVDNPYEPMFSLTICWLFKVEIRR
jgi:hypothetical protein